ncbi:MAG TPA: A24 family peptidase [Vicinamibacterales bacterium]|nr:A24 family peptidase [Vicinamibacterales bacterium]
MLKPFDVLLVSAVAFAGSASAFVDLRCRRVPNALTAGIAATGITFAATHATGLSVAASLVGAALGLLLMLPGYLIGGTGAGDVKLFAALGTLLGPSGIGVAFLYTAMAGGLLAVLVAVMRRRLRLTVGQTAALLRTPGAAAAEIEAPSNDNRFAYAPAIAIGALVAAVTH